MLIPMHMFKRACILALAASIASSSAFTQNAPPAIEGGAITPNAQTLSSPHPPASLTGKERLGEKWKDEQRIDNCNVPLDKRGAKPRLATCAPSS
jgi:hypothetical protein